MLQSIRIGASAAQSSTGGRCLRGRRVFSPGNGLPRAPLGGADHPAARASVAGARLGTKRPTAEVLLELVWLVGESGSLICERALEPSSRLVEPWWLAVVQSICMGYSRLLRSP